MNKLVAALVGFTGAEIGGSLLLCSTFELVSCARPALVAQRAMSANSSSDWLLVRDWTGELTNQIVGRIKQKLRAYGIVFDVRAPVLFSGRSIMFAKPQSSKVRVYLFEALGNNVWLWLNTTFDPGRALVEGDDDGAKPGDVIVF